MRQYVVTATILGNQTKHTESIRALTEKIRKDSIYIEAYLTGVLNKKTGILKSLKNSSEKSYT
jgi:hypothetical protein